MWADTGIFYAMKVIFDRHDADLAEETKDTTWQQKTFLCPWIRLRTRFIN